MRWFKKKQVQQSLRREPRLMAGQNDYIFRRSRTLTGSISPGVTASAAPRGQFKTDRLRLHELKAQHTRVLRILSAVVCLIGLLIFMIANFIFSPGFTPAHPTTRAMATTEYQRTMFAYFGDHPLERFGFMLNQPRFEAYLKREHAEILSSAVTRAWYGGNVRVVLYFRQPLLSWKTGDKQFFVDNQGVAFTYNHFSEPAVVVTDQTGLPPDQAGVIASTRFLRFLGQMVGAINDFDKGRVEAVIIPPSTRQIDLKLKGRSYPIKTNSDRDPLLQAEDIAFALAYLDEKGIKPHYVDVRVAHKAYYK